MRLADKEFGKMSHTTPNPQMKFVMHLFCDAVAIDEHV